jgi:Flp pilus assembly protein TadD
LASDPDNPKVLHFLGVAEHQSGQSERAVELLRRSVAVQPLSAPCHNNLGMVLSSLGRTAEAEDACRQALAIDPNSASAHNNLGAILAHQERFDEAIESFERSIALAPMAEAHYNLGSAFLVVGRYDDAIVQFRGAIDMRPDYADAHFAEAHLLLLAGRDMAEGWVKLEWRWQLPGKTNRWPTHSLWKGEPIGKRSLLLHAEQGFGDTLQFCRYSQLIQTDGPVFLAVPGPLVRLLYGLRGVNVIDQDDKVPSFDLHCPLLSLPHAFRTTIDSIPAATHYLSADFRQAAAWRDRLRELKGIRVGVVWAGGARTLQPAAIAIDRRRSIPFARFSMLLDAPGVTFVSLQKNSGQQARQLDARLHDWTNELRDFADTAALIDALDLVISVDTAVAHLAGALGKPVWLLNRFDTCWRWFLDREDTPWYPSMRLFRQPKPGDWDTTLARVLDALTVQSSSRPANGVH